MSTEVVGQIGSESLGYHPDLEGYGHDPEHAQELLNEARYEDGSIRHFGTVMMKPV